MEELRELFFPDEYIVLSMIWTFGSGLIALLSQRR